MERLAKLSIMFHIGASLLPFDMFLLLMQVTTSMARVNVRVEKATSPQKPTTTKPRKPRYLQMNAFLDGFMKAFLLLQHCSQDWESEGTIGKKYLFFSLFATSLVASPIHPLPLFPPFFLCFSLFQFSLPYSSLTPNIARKFGLNGNGNLSRNQKTTASSCLNVAAALRPTQEM